MSRTDPVHHGGGAPGRRSPGPAIQLLLASLPSGGSLPAEVWKKRHRFLLGLTWFHALVIALIGPALGYSWELSFRALFHDGTVLHTAAEGAVVALFAAAATWSRGGRTARATAVSFGLMSASAVLVHLSGGTIELHFHFFVMIVFLALYQDWVPYLLSIVYVALHHGVFGVLWPQEVYNHSAALESPWTWAGIHAFFVLLAAAGSVIAWRFNEKAIAQVKLILDSVGEGIFGMDRQGRVTFMNPAAAVLLGTGADEASGAEVGEILSIEAADGADAPADLSPMLGVLRDGSRAQVPDVTFRRRDGKGIPVDYVCTPIFERREVAGAVVTFTEITERRRADQALRSRFRELEILQEISDAILDSPELKVVMEGILDKIFEIGDFDFGLIRLLDSTGTTLEPVALRGYRDAKNIEHHLTLKKAKSKSRVVAQVLRCEEVEVKDLTDTEDMRTFRREGAKSLVTVPLRSHQDMLGVIHLASRTRTTFEKSDLRILSSIGRQAGIAFQKARLYEQAKQAQAALADKAAELSRQLDRIMALRDIGLAITSTLDLRAVITVLMERINGLLEFPSVLVWLINRETGVPERAACWNLDEAEWKGRNLVGVPALVRQAVAGRAPVVADNVQSDPRTLDPDFYRRHGLYSYLGVPLIVKGEALGVLVFLTRDKRRFAPEEIEFLSMLAGQAAIAIFNSQLYEKTKGQAAELAKANQMRADFVAMIAHDLRSPLMNITGAAEILDDGAFGAVNENQRDWLGKIRANSLSLIDLVSDFLDVSKLESGYVDVRKESVDLGPLIRKNVEDHSVLAGDKRVRVAADVDPALPVVQADPRRMEQVLTNLVTNAIKFSDDGGTVVIGAAPEGAAQVKVWVKDNGVGIPADEIGELFQKYRQSRNARGAGRKGTGLGLVICKMIVEAHGGKIGLASEPGHGATFYFTLPVS